MIKFAAICPHPPLMVDGVGKPEDLKIVKKTIDAVQKLAEEIAKENIKTVIIISPHGLIYPDRMNIWYGGEFDGDFSKFGAPDKYIEFMPDNDLAKKISDLSEENGIRINHYTENFDLDHGVMVPMHYLSNHLPEDVKIIPINYSYLDNATHYKFGQIIAEVCDQTDENIAIIASGDFSHRLLENGNGKEFDAQLVNDLKKNNIAEIIDYDEDWIEEAGECGYRSMMILFGALAKKKFVPEVLSYEGPFGVGYMVVNFKL